MPGVLEKLFQPHEGALVAVQFLGLLHAAVGAPGRQARLGWSQAPADEIVLDEREVRLDFADHFAVRALAMQKVAKLGEEPAHGSGPFHQQLVHQAGKAPPALGLLVERFLARFC